MIWPPRGERAWEQGQIDASEPLGVVAARMNRYLPGPHLLVAEDAAQIRISGCSMPATLTLSWAA
jgi:ferric-dicitrate binding protein FerR (iron transport regulator)